MEVLKQYKVSLLTLISFFFLFSNNLIAQEQEEKVYDHTEPPPSFPNGNSNIALYVNMNMRYPETALRDRIEGTVIVNFIVTKNGDLQDIAISKSVSPALDSEAIRIVQAMPKWIPGQHRRHNVNVKCSIPVWFNIGTYSAAIKMFRPERDSTGDRIPMPGYDLTQFLKDNIKYPLDALRENVEGIIRVKFVINKDGSITEPKVLYPTSERRSLEVEAIRIVKLMPKWQPALQQGQPVNIYFTLPVKFSLRDQ